MTTRRFTTLIGGGVENKVFEAIVREVSYYAVAHHGTAGMHDSYGYAQVVKHIEGDRAPQSDMTTTVEGPFDRRLDAVIAAAQMNVVLAHDERIEDAR